MICKICNVDISSKSITSHIKSHNMTSKEYYDRYLLTDNENKCRVCNKDTVFLGILSGYRKHCSNRCAQLNPETRNKCKKTCLIKYGAENVYASDYGKNKIKQTCLSKYGTEYALQSDEVKDRIKHTNLERYGVENPQQNKEIKEKTNQTNLSRYGNKCVIHNPDKWKKSVDKMKQNGHYSRLELKLEQFFIDNNINYTTQYFDSRYPYMCDFYLPDTDTFIEVNAYWHHGGHFYDKNNESDIKMANDWKERSKIIQHYSIALTVWTKRDPIKYKCAKTNNLNYIVFWSEQDIDNYISNYKK